MKRQKTIKERICTMNYLMLLCMVLMLIFIIPIDPPNPFPWDLSRPIGMKKLGQFFC